MEVQPTINSAPHILVIPYPGRGHINPMMNLCRLLASNNAHIKFTFVVTEEWFGFIGNEPKPDNVGFGTIPNVIPSEASKAKDFLNFFNAVMTKMGEPLEQFVDRLEHPPTIILYDSFLFCVVDIGNRRNIPVAAFWTMTATYFSVLYHHHLLEENGHYPVNLLENGGNRVSYLPGMSPTRLMDIPCIDGSPLNRHILQWLRKAVSWVPKAQCLLIPSIYELESKVFDVLKQELPLSIYAVGFPINRDRLSGKSTSFTDSNNYIEWLDNQPASSVLYISQGSFHSHSTAQIDEIAAGLRDSGVRFLWIGRAEASRLTGICGNRGLVLPWCDQMRVLLHPAIGGFWTHCGWNSTTEGVIAGVPFLTNPIGVDQPMNEKLIVEDWKVGWRVTEEFREAGTLVTKDEIAGLLHKFMDLENDESRAMRKRAKELQQICQQSIAKGGSSENNINAFLKNIRQ